MQQEFDLIYVGDFDYLAIEKMSVFERRYFYELLAKTKEREKEQREEQRKRVRGQRSSGGKRTGKRGKSFRSRI